MNPKKKPRTSLYSDQLDKHWSNCSAGFEGLPSRNKSSSKESQKKKFKYGGWKDQWEKPEEEEEKEEVDIKWSSSSEDEEKEVKDTRTLDTLSNRSRLVPLQNAPSGRKGECRQEKKRSSLPGKASVAFRRSKSPGKEDTSLEDFIVSDSGSDGDDRERLGKLEVQSPKDEPCHRTDIGTAGVKSAGVHEGPLRKGRKTTPSAGARSDKTVMSSQFVDRRKRRYAQSKQDSFEPEILDYDSPTEEESPAFSEPISDPSSASQSSWSRGLQPNTFTTSPRPNPSNPLGSPRTGSEWVKKLKLQASITPERRSGGAGGGRETKGGGSTSGAGIVDSARKKKKFVNSGLAERLQRLVSREKSSVAMWHHNRADSQNSQESTKLGLVVQVLSCETHRGLYLTHCVTQVSSGAKVDAGSNLKGEGDEAGLSQGDEMYVFFTRSTGDKLGLAKGMVISINTPWQKLSIPDVSKPVVLCTYLCRTLNLDPYDAVQGQPVLHEYPTEGSKSPKVLNPVRLFPAASRSHSPGAEVVTTTQENKIKNISASIIHSVTETGACSSAGVSFKARVQRIVTRRQQTVVSHQSAKMTSGRILLPTQASPSLIKSLLLQDREGVVCEVQLTNQMAESSTWQQVLQSGVGRSYIFMNLRVTQRLTLGRAPGLLSMIRSLQRRPNQMNGQTVCYVLTSEVGVTAVESLDQSESMNVPPLRPPAVMELSDVVKNTHTPTRRTSFLATPILLSSTSPDSDTPSSGGPKDTPNTSESWFLFLSTSSSQHHQPSTTPQEESTSLRKHGSDQDEYVCLHVHQSNVLGHEVLTRCRSSGNKRILCRDVLVASTEEGVYLNADGFSHISVEDESAVQSASNLALSVLKVGTRLHSLVCVTGNICGVEEESAFSWPSCPHCGNNHLDGGEGSGFVLHCCVCNEDINTPIMRMHLIVQLTCPALPPTHTVKVQLLQSTIESVLPSPSSQASGGHDLQSTLGVLVGPINCLVRTVNETSEGKMFLLEEVLLCN